LSIIQKLEQKAPAMRIVRLPGIHHDSNVVVVIGSAGNLLIDAGTSWYQSLQVERITGVLDGGSLDRILLTCRRFPCSGGAKHISEMFSNCPIHIHEEGQASLSSGDFFTTWSNRFDSDMPFTTSLIVEDGELFILGDCQVSTIPLPGHSIDGMGYYVDQKKLLIAGALIPRADRPSRWDLPTGCLPDIVSSLKLIKTMNLESLIPLQGPAIKGKKHITEVLEKHINFFIKCIEAEGIAPKSWSRPAQTAIWHTPHPPWPLEEREDA
jgi:glyoxylase-like metal-dependent hydrolase (beta-lactamase superfamily II)